MNGVDGLGAGRTGSGIWVPDGSGVLVSVVSSAPTDTVGATSCFGAVVGVGLMAGFLGTNGPAGCFVGVRGVGALPTRPTFVNGITFFGADGGCSPAISTPAAVPVGVAPTPMTVFSAVISAV